MLLHVKVEMHNYYNSLNVVIIIILLLLTLFQEDNIFGTNANLTYGPRLQR